MLIINYDEIVAKRIRYVISRMSATTRIDIVTYIVIRLALDKRLGEEITESGGGLTLATTTIEESGRRKIMH